MSKARRIFVGNVAFTFTKGSKSVTFTVQARMEIKRQTTGTAENPLETWQMTGSRIIIATAGFETRYFDDPPLTFPCQMDMRAGAEDWYAALEKILLSQVFLERTRKYFAKKFKARGSFKRGRIWEERA